MKKPLTDTQKQDLAHFFWVDADLIGAPLNASNVRDWEHGLVRALYALHEHQEDFNRALFTFEQETAGQTKGLGDKLFALHGEWKGQRDWYSPASWRALWLMGFASDVHQRRLDALNEQADDRYECLWKLLKLYQHALSEYAHATARPFAHAATVLKEAGL